MVMEFIKQLAVIICRPYIRYSPLNIGSKWLFQKVKRIPRHFVAKTCFGVSIEGSTTDLIQRAIYYFGIWEPNLSSYLIRTLAPGDTFVDVGANIGYYTLLSSKIVGNSGQVVAIEPSPTIYNMLAVNLSRNSVRNVTVHQAAVLDRETEIQIFLGNEHNIGATSIQPTKHAHELEATVRASPLHQFLTEEQKKSVRFIKIDAEGAEPEVLRGMKPILENHPRCLEIMVEITISESMSGTHSDHPVIEMMTSYGFHPYEVVNCYDLNSYIVNRRPSPPTRLHRPLVKSTDIIFSHRDAEYL